MSRILMALTLFVMVASFPSCAVEKPAARPLRKVNVLDLRIINKGWDDTARPFGRLQAWLEDSVRETLWERSQCSSGIAVRFATNSTRVGVRYLLRLNTHMPHMADTGLKGTDLYIFEEGEPKFPGDSRWRHVNTNRPGSEKDSKWNEKIYVENLDGKMHDYMIYLPLYDGVEEMYVLVEDNAVVTTGFDRLIRPEKKIVAYGTSILQGGCASRPGMAATNIISRALNCEVVNLGISGEGKMDFVMARAMAAIPDVDLFLLDPVPNSTEMMCDTLTYDFVNILRKARPDVPIVMLEGPLYPYARYDSYFGDYLPRKNAAFRRNYERLKAENPANLYYVDNIMLDGIEDDGTIDGIHLSDLGFKHYADKLIPILKPLIK